MSGLHPQFAGSIKATVDGKSRLMVPAKFKEQLLLDEAGGGSVVVSRWADQCLAVHPLSEWRRHSQEIARKSMANASWRKYRRVFVGTAEELRLDSQNRILLPEPLRVFAGVTREVVLVGDVERFLIYDAAQWDSYQRMEDEEFSSLFEQIHADQPIESQ